jgi:cbb3-type cytochrome oxidase subunit 3
LATLDADGWKVMGVLLLTALVIGGLIWLFRAKKKRRQRAGTVQG